MQVIQPNPSFKPIHLILETQAEVDALYAILNHSWIMASPQIAAALGNESYLELKQFTTEARDSLHSELSKFLSKEVSNVISNAVNGQKLKELS